MPFLAPAFAAVTAFASTALGSIILNVGLAIGASLLSSLLAPQPDAPQPSGMRISTQIGDTLPLSFPVGYVGTAGSKKYSMSWGSAGGVPNAYVTEVFQLSDLPSTGLDGFWANKQRCTILWGDPPAGAGYPVLEFRVGGVDHMWVRYRTGYETTADTFLVSTFGTHPEYPWTSAFIGRGAAHAVVTTLYNRELFSSVPTCMFEPTPTNFYDLRKDTTNGGSGSHRWDNPLSWEPTLNPVVITYNIVRGVYYGSTWIYGGRNLPAFRLPPSSWIAAANECDAPRSLAGGGTEPQFRCGLEVNVNVEPLATIEELLKTCSARMSEIGGIFEILVGAPGAAVYSFTDDNIMISRGQKYSSFPSLANTYNAIEATYPEPSEMWASKSAPARFNAAYEAEDGGRRLATGVALNAVPFAIQAQQLMATLIEDDRRWRTHWITLPPDAWILTGTCVVNWSSARNGYTNKKFLVIQADGEPGMSQSVVLREIDPTDYGWISAQELPNPVGNLVILRPAPQVVTGFTALPAILYDDDGDPRRPAIQITYDGNMPDIRAISILVRLKSSGAYVFEGEVPFAVPYSFLLSGDWLLNATIYEVAIKYVPFSGRPTEFTMYQEVLTPDVKLYPGKDFDPFGDVVDFDTIGPGLTAWIARMGMTARELIDALQSVATNVGDQETANAGTFSEIRTELSTSIGTVSANFEQSITVAIVPLEDGYAALADYLTELSAGDGSDVSTARFRMTTVSGTAGYSTIGAQTRVDTADPGAWRGAAWFLETPNDPLLPTRFLVNADQFIVVSGGGLEAQLMIFDGTALRVNNALVRTASIADAAITNAKIVDATITGAKIANATIGTAQIALAAIDTAQIANGAIQNAQIGTAAITSAKIGDLEVDTIKIAGQAIATDVVTTGTSGTILGGSDPINYFSNPFVATDKVCPYFCKYTFTNTGGTGQYTKVLLLHNVTTGVITQLDTVGGNSTSVTNFTGLLTDLVAGQTYRLAHYGSYSNTSFNYTINWTSAVTVRKR